MSEQEQRIFFICSEGVAVFRFFRSSSRHGDSAPCCDSHRDPSTLILLCDTLSHIAHTHRTYRQKKRERRGLLFTCERLRQSHWLPKASSTSFSSKYCLKMTKTKIVALWRQPPFLLQSHLQLNIALFPHRSFPIQYLSKLTNQNSQIRA